MQLVIGVTDRTEEGARARAAYLLAQLAEDATATDLQHVGEEWLGWARAAKVLATETHRGGVMHVFSGTIAKTRLTAISTPTGSEALFIASSRLWQDRAEDLQHLTESWALRFALDGEGRRVADGARLLPAAWNMGEALVLSAGAPDPEPEPAEVEAPPASETARVSPRRGRGVETTLEVVPSVTPSARAE